MKYRTQRSTHRLPETGNLRGRQESVATFLLWRYPLQSLMSLAAAEAAALTSSLGQLRVDRRE